MTGYSRAWMLPLGLLLAWAATAASPGTQKATAPGKVGHQRLNFTQRHPLSTLDEVVRRLDIHFDSMTPDAVALAKQEYDLPRESFEVFVPSTYKPEVPHGLFVWVGVTPVSPDWLDVLGRHKFICVTAIPARGTIGLSRSRLPLDAVHNMKRLYRIDEARICLSGFSAGAGLASQLICGFPDVFHGGYFLMGGSFCVVHKTAAGTYEPTLERLAPNWKGPLDKIKKEVRLVLMRAEGDTIYSPQEDRAQYTGLLLDGFERVNYLVLASGGHRPPNTPSFERGLISLELPPQGALVTAPTDQPNPLPGQLGQAQRLLATAQLNLERKYPSQYTKEQVQRFRKSAQDRARKYLQQVISEYPATAPAAQARQLLAEMDETKSP
jgi:hypothetical protein